MSPQHRDEPRHTGLAIAALLAIPFGSVTLAAQLGNTASSTDPREAIAAGIALVGGLAMGLLVRRLVLGVDRQLRGAFQLLVMGSRPRLGLVDDIGALFRRVRPVDQVVPSFAFLPAEVGRRGPPIRLR